MLSIRIHAPEAVAELRGIRQQLEETNRILLLLVEGGDEGDASSRVGAAAASLRSQNDALQTFVESVPKT